MNRIQRIILWNLIFATGLSLWILCVFRDPYRAWVAVLGGFIFFAPLTSGLITWSAIVKASHGTWPGNLERIPLSAIGCMVPTSLVLIALWIANSYWQPLDTQHDKHIYGIWYNPGFLFTRDLLSFALFWIIAFQYHRKRVNSPAHTFAVWLIITYSFAITIISFDLVMGLKPGWNSSVFGVYVFITGLYAAAAAWTISAILSRFSLGPEKGMDHVAQFDSKSKLHDLSKLVFAFAILSSYLLFCQLLPIWYENLPSETIFLIPRMNLKPWDYISAGLLIVVFVGPVLYLLPIKVKKTPWIAGLACCVITSGLWVERLWLILPTLKIRSLALADFATLFALFGMCATCMEIADRFVPSSFPTEDSDE